MLHSRREIHTCKERNEYVNVCEQMFLGSEHFGNVNIIVSSSQFILSILRHTYKIYGELWSSDETFSPPCILWKKNAFVWVIWNHPQNVRFFGRYMDESCYISTCWVTGKPTSLLQQLSPHLRTWKQCHLALLLSTNMCTLTMRALCQITAPPWPESWQHSTSWQSCTAWYQHTTHTTHL